MKRTLIFLLTLVIVFGISVHSHATLTAIGTASYDNDGDGISENYKLIYDNDSPFGSIVWLDCTSYYSGSWYDAVSWVAGLNTAGALTFNLNPGVNVAWDGEWRLPLTVDDVLVDNTDIRYYDGTGPNGYNITTSEMGHLFYEELGNLGQYDTSGNQRADGYGLLYTGDFDNLRNMFIYWSDTVYAADEDLAWSFHFHTGWQRDGLRACGGIFALAVHLADVTLSTSPEEQIEDIQDFFDEVVSSEDLTGLGATKTAAVGKLNAFGNMLEEAEYLIDSGYIEEACNQLNAIYMKTDGAILPPDFVTGDATDELAAQILTLMDTLGCE